MFELTRRDFFRSTAGLALLDGRLEAKLTDEERCALFAIARTVFYHDSASDDIYWRAVGDIERKCRDDLEMFTLVTHGLGTLDGACRGGFGAATDRTRIGLLKLLANSQFYRRLYVELLDSLYGMQDAWTIFGGLN